MSSISASGTLYIRHEGNDVQSYSTNGTSYSPITSWPLTVSNSDVPGSPLKVIFTTGLFLSSTDRYFICGSNNIQFGDNSLDIAGKRITISINGVDNYTGLIHSSKRSNIKVFNLHVDGKNSSLAPGGGWICQNGFGNDASGCSIINCSSSGNISFSGGGIVGGNSGSDTQPLSIRDCYSKGAISGGGGIAGGSCKQLNIDRCFSTGNISKGGGGIVGKNNGLVGLLTITRCYSTGQILNASGGIVGDNCSVESGNTDISGCYSTGPINDSGGGGIANGNVGSDGKSGNNGSIVISNCYTTGTIASNAGGIIGGVAKPGYITISNCYTSGSVQTAKTGIYAATTDDPSNCYSEAAHGNSGAWSDTNANTALQQYPSGGVPGDTWVSRTSNSPYDINYIGYTPYQAQIIDDNGDIVIVYNVSVEQGSTIAPPLVPNASIPSIYSILSINGQLPSSFPFISMVFNGSITTTNTALVGSYVILVAAYFSDRYIYSVVYLRITGGGGGGGNQVAKIENLFDAGKASGEMIADIRAGFAIASCSIGKPLKFNTYDGYLKYIKAAHKKYS